jgi:hypothetical protein
VAAAAQALEEGEGFTARVERSYTTACAEEVAEETGESAEEVEFEARTLIDYHPRP